MSQIKVDSLVPRGGIPSGAEGGGIIQVVTGYNSGRTTTSSTTFATLVTGPSITPRSASNKVLICLSTMVSRNGSNGNAYFAVYRNATTSLLQSGQEAHFGHWNDYNQATQNNTSWLYLDNPATTSATSYSIMGRTDATQACVGGRGGDNNHNVGVLWTIMEVSG